MQYIHTMRLIAMLAVLCPTGGSHALTIYRIGGESTPPPELDAPYEFVQLAWADVDEDRHGSIEQLDLGSDRIAPQRLDSDVNLTPLIEKRGGKIMILDWQAGWTPHDQEDGLVFDGDPNTAYLGDGHYTRAPGYGPPHKYWIFDFGGRFLIERIRIYPRQAFLSDRFIERFLIGINDGDPLKDGSRDYPVIWYWQFASARNTGVDFDIIHDISENTQSLIELEIPPTPIRSLYFEAPENTRGIWEIAEFEIYGGGHAPFASYVSNVIDLGRPASLGELVWSGGVEEGGGIKLNARSGGDLDPNAYWRYTFRGDEQSRFDREGRLIDRQGYAKLERGEKAGVTHDTENWQAWGAPVEYAAGGIGLGGDRPQSTVQFRVDFASTPTATGWLDYVQFAASDPPVVSEILAEIGPGQVRAGEATLFTYRIRPFFAVGDLGFDSIAIDTPERPLSVDAVRVAGEEVAYEVLRQDDSGLAVRIAPVGIGQTGDLIEVDFRAEVFRFGTVFTGQVFASEKAYEVPQAVQAGDADPLSGDEGLRVVLREIGRHSLQAVRLASSVFTPNGDGVNDQAEIEYELLNVERVPVAVEIYDLAGRKVGELSDGERGSGRFVARWDGRGTGGDLLPPGTYLVQLAVERDGGRETVQRVVGLAY